MERRATYLNAMLKTVELNLGQHRFGRQGLGGSRKAVSGLLDSPPSKSWRSDTQLGRLSDNGGQLISSSTVLTSPLDRVASESGDVPFKLMTSLMMGNSDYVAGFVVSNVCPERLRTV